MWAESEFKISKSPLVPKYAKRYKNDQSMQDAKPKTPIFHTHFPYLFCRHTTQTSKVVAYVRMVVDGCPGQLTLFGRCGRASFLKHFSIEGAFIRTSDKIMK